MTKVTTISGHQGLQMDEPLIFELDSPGSSGVDLPAPPVVKSRLGPVAVRNGVGLPGLTEPEVVRHASCEARARGFAPDLPQPDTARVVDDRYLALDGDLAAHLVTAVAPAPGERDLLEGSVLLVAADVHRCLVLSYVTLAAGDGAPAVLGERLAVIAEATAKGLRRDRELSGAAPPRERR